eukprot:scaffold8161_cov111-Cylindrotheca_fusiformis.AAC.8
MFPSPCISSAESASKEANPFKFRSGRIASPFSSAESASKEANPFKFASPFSENNSGKSLFSPDCINSLCKKDSGKSFFCPDYIEPPTENVCSFSSSDGFSFSSSARKGTKPFVFGSGNTTVASEAGCKNDDFPTMFPSPFISSAKKVNPFSFGSGTASPFRENDRPKKLFAPDYIEPPNENGFSFSSPGRKGTKPIVFGSGNTTMASEAGCTSTSFGPCSSSSKKKSSKKRSAKKRSSRKRKAAAAGSPEKLRNSNNRFAANNIDRSPPPKMKKVDSIDILTWCEEHWHHPDIAHNELRSALYSARTLHPKRLEVLVDMDKAPKKVEPENFKAAFEELVRTVDIQRKEIAQLQQTNAQLQQTTATGKSMIAKLQKGNEDIHDRLREMKETHERL